MLKIFILPFLINLSNKHRDKYVTILVIMNTIIYIINSLLQINFDIFFIFKIVAPRAAGMNNKNAYSAATSLSIFLFFAPNKHDPLREIPGNIPTH